MLIVPDALMQGPLFFMPATMLSWFAIAYHSHHLPYFKGLLIRVIVVIIAFWVLHVLNALAFKWAYGYPYFIFK